MSYLNEKIKEARNKKRITQREAAEYLGISDRTYQRYEKDIEPSIDTIKRLSTLFEVDILSGNPSPADDPINWERAAIKAIMHALAKTQAKVAKLAGHEIPEKEYLEDLDKSTNLILDDLRRSVRKEF